MKMMMRLILVVALLMVTACASSPSQPKAVTEGEHLLSRGVAAYHDDELLSAAGYFTKALLHYQGLDDRNGQLQSRIDLVEVSLAVGNLAAARQHLEQAELLAYGTLAGYQPRLMLLRSSLALASGDAEGARKLSDTLLPPKLGGTGDGKVSEQLQRQALINRTDAAFVLNEDDVTLWVSRLEGVAKGDPLSEARVARFHAQLARRRGDSGAAASQLGKALQLCKALPSRRCIAATLEEWGELLLAGNDLTGAQDRYQRALAVRMAMLDRGGAGSDLHQLAQISQSAGRDDEATTYRQWADTLAGDDAVSWGQLRHDTLPR